MNLIKRLLIQRAIKKDIQAELPGWDGIVEIDSDGLWDVRTSPDCRKDWYDKYPSLTRRDADVQILHDVAVIVRRHHQGARFLGYEQHGRYHRV